MRRTRSFATRLATLAMTWMIGVGSSGCSGGSGAPDPSDGGPVDGGAVDATPPPTDGGSTWTAIYAAYVGPGTPGHCGNAACHQLAMGGFKCGTSAASCYAGLVAAGQIDPSNPTASVLADPNQTPLSWFGTGGNMPRDNTVTNAQAAVDVMAWVRAGAQNN